MAGIESTFKKYPQYSIFYGVLKGMVVSQISKRSEEELRNDIESVMFLFKKCMEGDIGTNNP